MDWMQSLQCGRNTGVRAGFTFTGFLQVQNKQNRSNHNNYNNNCLELNNTMQHMNSFSFECCMNQFKQAKY